MIVSHRVLILMIGILLVVLSAFVQIRLKMSLGYTFDAVLAMMIVAIFFFGPLEWVVLFLVAILCLMWKPWWGSEMSAWAGVVLAAFFLKKIFPSRPIVTLGILITVATTVFLLINGSAVLGNVYIVCIDMFASFCYGAIIFSVLERWCRVHA